MLIFLIRYPSLIFTAPLILFNKRFIYFYYIFAIISFYTTVKIYLVDSIEAHENLLPLSFLRPLADFRCGILTLRQKWERYLPGDYAYCPVEYLKDKFGCVTDPQEEALFVAGNMIPSAHVAKCLAELQSGQGFRHKDSLVAFRGNYEDFLEEKFQDVGYPGDIRFLEYIFDVFLANPEEIKSDFKLITKGRKSAPIPACVRFLESQGNSDEEDSHDSIFIEPGATLECATINVTEGPVYIGKDAVLMEGACIRGPFALCEDAEVRMGAKIYEGTTIGPHCKVGGEVSNTVFFGFSNKAHDGYLGNAIIGEWCNIGAGTNASNLKNDYSLIRVWNYRTRSFMRTDLQFCGLIMGDHSKIGVNCMINTATVMGVGVNVHGAGFPRTFLANFCEGSPITGFTQIPLKKFLDTASRVMSRRDISLSPADEALLKKVYES